MQYNNVNITHNINREIGRQTAKTDSQDRQTNKMKRTTTKKYKK